MSPSAACSAQSPTGAEEVDLLGKRLDLAGERRRRRELHVAANLLEQRPQIRIRADPLQLGDLRADGLEALREPLDALGTGQCPDQPADLLEFAEETGQRVVVPAGGSGRRHAVQALREAPDILGDAAVDVLGDFLGQALDLRPHLLDRRRDGGEVGAGLRPLDAARQGDHRLLQGDDVPARGELRDRLAQAHGLVLKLGQGGGRPGHLLDPRLEAAGEVHAHAGDDAAIRIGRRGRGRRQFALPLADVLHGAADVARGGAPATAGLAGGGDLLAELRHAALDVAQALGHLLHGGRLQGALDPRLDLGQAPRLGILHAAAFLIEGPVEALETVDQCGQAVTVGFRDAGRADLPVELRGDVGSGHRLGELLGPVTATLAAVARTAGFRLRDHRGDPGLQRHAGPRRHVPGGVEHLGIETVELRHRGAGHRGPIVGSSASNPGCGAGTADRYPRNARIGSFERDH